MADSLSLSPDLSRLREVAASAERAYSYRNGEPENVELRAAIVAAEDALQIVSTLVAMQTAKREIARAQGEAERATNLHSTLHDLLIEQRTGAR